MILLQMFQDNNTPLAFGKGAGLVDPDQHRLVAIVPVQLLLEPFFQQIPGRLVVHPLRTGSIAGCPLASLVANLLMVRDVGVVIDQVK